MRPNLVVGVICLIALLLGQRALSQPVVVTVKPTGGAETAYGIAHASGADFEIDVGAVVTAFPNGFDYIRVRDSTAPSAVDIGTITLSNPSSVQLPAIVRLLLTSATEDVPGFPINFIDPLATSCYDWEGLALASTGFNETRVILSAAVAHNITGPVMCGQVYTLQAIAGTIASDVRATWVDGLGPDDAPDPTGDFVDYTIQQVRAKYITGRIIAGDIEPSSAAALCSIRSIRVGAGFTIDDAAISGNILAYGGHIRSIDCFGHIGTATAPVLIHAGYGLGHLECSAQVNGQTVARNVYADLRTNFMPPQTNSNLDNDGYIGRSA